MRNLKFAKLVPGGNTTIIILDRVPRKHQPVFARTIMKQHADCEQVGFVEPANDQQAICRLQMMGGEFCGNATRSLAWLVMEHYLHHGHTPNAEAKDKLFGSNHLSLGKKMNVLLEVSGARHLLNAECLLWPYGELKEVVVPMPIRHIPSDCLIKQSLPWGEKEMQVTIIHLDGISHVVVEAEQFSAIGGHPGNLQEVKRILMEFGLDQIEAAGVLFTSSVGDSVTMNPVVYVRETDTLIPETACGSGTVALAQKFAFEKGDSVFVKIIQPSGEIIVARVEMKDGKFDSAFIMGKVKICEEGVLSIPDEDNPLKRVEIRQIRNSAEIVPYADKIGALYVRVFADHPYYERFTLEEGYNYLIETAEARHGLLFLAFDGDEVVGFGGGLPLTYYPDICKVVSGHLNPERTFYVAELGVDHCYRSEGLSHQLIDARLNALNPVDFDHVLGRTSVVNNITHHLYCDRRGFTIIPGVRQQVISRKFLPGAAEPQDVPDERLFFISSVEAAKQHAVT